MSTNDITLHTYKNINPMIYAYNTPGVTYHEGWTKIGYTEAQTVEKRIDQQTGTADIQWVLAWKHNALYQDGSFEMFSDHDFHNYLEIQKHIERKYDEDGRKEWFHIDGRTSKKYFDEFSAREWRVLNDIKSDYTLRDEQNCAVDMTKAYFEKGGTEFLWNAKPRFGKCLSAYDLVRRMGMKNVLIVTNRPSVANSWLDDYVKFIQWRDEYRFVTGNDALKKSVNSRFVMSRKQFVDEKLDGSHQTLGMIAFESLQGLKGSVYHGGKYDKLDWIHELKFDLLIVDESHEGVDTQKTDWAFENIHRKHTLYLSGTPFKAIANEEFGADQVFNWSYSDEQAAKERYELSGESNPYERLPRMSMFTYQLSAMIRDKLEKGCMISDEETVDYAFDLNEFFKTNESGDFIHLKEIEKFLDALTTNEKYPFSTPELRNELHHTLWLLDRVNSAKALAKLLKKHPVFENYEIVVAAGDGMVDEDEKRARAFDKVTNAIRKHDKTITLSVGQLTVGVTVPEWSGVLMLCNMSSPAAYMQAAFRAQNPYTFKRMEGKKLHYYRKENAYIFDFDPARTLIIFDEFANNLSLSTSDGRGTASDREENVRRLLNFFPVLGEDDDGKMIELDAAKVLTIPRRIKSLEVVRRGFMSNFLFQNIANIFGAPGIVKDIVGKLSPAFDDMNVKKTKPGESKPLDHIEDVPVDESGEVDISHEIVIGTAIDILGEKKWKEIEADALDAVNEIDISTPKAEDISDNTAKIIENTKIKMTQLKENIATNIKGNVVPQIAQNYGAKTNQKKKMDAQVEAAIDTKIDRRSEEYEQSLRIARVKLERRRNEAEASDDDAILNTGIATYQEDVNKATRKFTDGLQQDVVDIMQSVPQSLVETQERLKAEAEKKSIEENVRAHLRGFSRSIPSFLMAYGDDDLTLSNFDKYTEPEVFKEVTGITLEDFIFLRDGGDYINETTGKTEHFKGQLFDEIVFNDSVKEFMNKRRTLANYFDESLDEDIFNYIPPQKTNQIFTPKWVVQKMIDELEKEDPGCFDNPEHTFADLYMKSGLYITEIVKRLFHSDGQKKAFPDESDRIHHIIQHQVYGMAPTRIIYLIATNYILGFDESLKRETTHFVQADAAEASKSGNLQQLVDKYWGE